MEFEDEDQDPDMYQVQVHDMDTPLEELMVY